ncbi:DUF397 domain-containing protein [Actinomadura harenae]|uniref:DUF397 domain-containing protein n=2 Tax=Actinomadura harenae TaxID=2483351 RepID=A0A3M2LY27_9ACTN|nr:DUF397 domain-containing protein [Actinomadura harenae]
MGQGDPHWRKSSYSGENGGNCIELATLTAHGDHVSKGQESPRWRKSSHSTDNGGACVELAGLRPVVGVRDSKDPDGPHLTMSQGDLAALSHVIRNTRPRP